jgi:hypothetical protein
LPYNQPALPKGNEVACNVAIDQSGMPAICFGTGMPHNSPNACINKDGYLTLQVEFYNQSSCFNISGPSLATNASASTVFVSPNPQATFDFRLLPSAHQRLPCFTPFPTGVGPRTVASGSALKIDDHLNGNRCGTEILLWNGLCQPTKNWPPNKPLTRKVVTPTYLAAKPRAINVSIGRQLFVDTFMVQSSHNIKTSFYAPEYADDAVNPVLKSTEMWEVGETAGSLAGTAKAVGVWWVSATKRYEMFYRCGSNSLCLAYSGAKPATSIHLDLYVASSFVF